MSWRRFSSYRGRKLRPDEVVLEKFAMSAAGYQFLLRVAPKIDRVVIPRTKGKFSSTGVNKVGLVTSTGAKSGQKRTHPLALVVDGEDLFAIASNYGRPKHPSWSYNLLADPDCDVEFQGPPARYRAELLTGAERAAAWTKIVDFYAGYDRYRVKCAPREIRVFRLHRAADKK